MKPATPLAVGKDTQFTLDRNESVDLSVNLAKSTSYYLQADLRLVEGRMTNIQMQMDLLKSNGAMVKSYLLSANDIHAVSRVAATFTAPAAGAYRIRVKNAGMPMEYWVRLMPAAKRTFVAFPTGNAEFQPLAIGPENGKGGLFGGRDGEDPWFAYHRITLQPGKYNISLYMRQTEEGMRTNLQGQIRLLDPYGVGLASEWWLVMNAIDYEARIEKPLVVIKPTTYIFKVWNNMTSRPAHYTVGIEKA